MELKTYLQELEYLVNIDSGTETLSGVAKVADFFATRFTELGWNVHVEDLAPNAGPCVFCTNRKAEHYDLMLIGHMDTVFLEGTCAQRPFRMDETKAYGPGVSDMKQGCLLMYYLMRDLPKEVNDKLNILCIFNPDEEVGSKFSSPVYADYAKKTDYAFVYEAQSSDGTRAIERKGGIGFTVEFTGKSGHCGKVFTNGAKSAVSEMARWIVKLDSIQSKERNTSINVGVAGGGTKMNVVPDFASLCGSMRFILPEEEKRLDDTIAELQKAAEERGIGTKVTLRKKLPMLPTEKGRAYFAHVAELAKANGMEFATLLRGGMSDGNIIAQYGPICLDGMGPKGGNGHSEDEYLLLDSIRPSYDFSMLLIKDLAENK